MSQPLRVVVADDEPVMRDALCDTLLADARIAVVGRASTEADLEDAVARLEPRVVLLDVGLADDATALIRRLTGPPAPVVVLAVSARSDQATVLLMLRAGAAGYLAKDRLGGVLAEAVVRAAHGEALLAVPGGRAILARLLG